MIDAAYTLVKISAREQRHISRQRRSARVEWMSRQDSPIHGGAPAGGAEVCPERCRRSGHLLHYRCRGCRKCPWRNSLQVTHTLMWNVQFAKHTFGDLMGI